MGEEFRSLSNEDKVYNLNLQLKKIEEKIERLKTQEEGIKKKISLLEEKGKKQNS